MARPEARCLVARSDEGIVGFAWGYEVSVDANFAEEIKASRIHHHLHGTHFYIDEVGLLKPYRRHGIGTAMVQRLVGDKYKGRTLLRTLGKSPMQKLVDKIHGNQLEDLGDGRCIFTL